MIFSLIIGFILGAAALLFALQNTEIVALTFLGWQFQGSLAMLTLASLGIGILICILVAIPSTLGASFRISSLQKQNKKLIQEVEANHQPQVVVVGPEEPPQVVDLRN